MDTISKTIIVLSIIILFILFIYWLCMEIRHKEKMAQLQAKKLLKQSSPQTLPQHNYTEYHRPIKVYPNELQYNKLNIATKKARKEHNNFTVLDFETTGLSPITDSIIEIGAVKIKDGQITDTFSLLVNPGHRIPSSATKVNGITDNMVKDAPRLGDILPAFISFIGDSILVGHNAYAFDIKFLLIAAYDNSFDIKNPVVDTLPLCRKLFPDFTNHKLGTIAEQLCIEMDSAHRSLCDATATAQIFLKCIDMLNKQDIVKEQERTLRKESAKVIEKV